MTAATNDTFPVLCGWCQRITGYATVAKSTSMCSRCLEDYTHRLDAHDNRIAPDEASEYAASVEWSDNLGVCWLIVGVLAVAGAVSWFWRMLA